MVMGRPIEWTPERLKALGEELLAHVQMPGVYTIGSFAIEKEMTEAKVYQLAKEHEEHFSKYLTRAKDILANKLIGLGIEKGLDNFYYNYMIPMHSSSVEERRQKMRKEKLEDDMAAEEHKRRMANHDENAIKSDQLNRLLLELQEENKRLREQGNANPASQ